MSQLLHRNLKCLAIIVLMLVVSIDYEAVAQFKAPAKRSDPVFDYKPQRVSAEAGWPGNTRADYTKQANQTGRIQLTSSSDSKQPPAPPLDEESLPTGPTLERAGPIRTIREYSRIHIEPPPRKQVKLHDIVTIIVDEKSEVIMNQKFSRQRNSGLKADLKSFVRFGETGNLVNAAGNNPKIDGQMSSNINNTGTVTDQEGIKYRIAAKVADVKPNGTILLEAKKVIQTQDDVSEYTLTGEVRSIDINSDNTASSENIANLQIVKRQEGRVYSSTKRNWGVRILDFISPF